MAASEFSLGRGSNNEILGVSTKPKYQDGSETPQVSPISASSLTLTRPNGAVRLHITCDAAYKAGEGTLAGTADNGYVPVAENTWYDVECVGLDSIPVATQSGSAGNWAFLWDMCTAR